LGVDGDGGKRLVGLKLGLRFSDPKLIPLWAFAYAKQTWRSTAHERAEGSRSRGRRSSIYSAGRTEGLNSQRNFGVVKERGGYKERGRAE
jgi:hypothetical protein